MHNDYYNDWTPEGIAYNQDPARKEQGFAAVIFPDDLRARVVLHLRLNLQWSHKYDRANAQWYDAAIEFMNAQESI